MRPSAVQTTLESYDILFYLFDHIHDLGKGGRAILASCAGVCHTWQEPASYVLWRNLASFHPLWNLLDERKFSPDAKWAAAFWQVDLRHNLDQTCVDILTPHCSTSTRRISFRTSWNAATIDGNTFYAVPHKFVKLGLQRARRASSPSYVPLQSITAGNLSFHHSQSSPGGMPFLQTPPFSSSVLHPSKTSRSLSVVSGRSRRAATHLLRRSVSATITTWTLC